MQKEIKIEVPEGYVIDKENSTFECIKFKPKQLTYDDIAKELFLNKRGYFIGNREPIGTLLGASSCDDVNNCPTIKQANKIIALNKLHNVAYYLNGMQCIDKNKCYTLYLNDDNEIIIVFNMVRYSNGRACFKTEELAKQAIEILGEETIKEALC